MVTPPDDEQPYQRQDANRHVWGGGRGVGMESSHIFIPLSKINSRWRTQNYQNPKMKESSDDLGFSGGTLEENEQRYHPQKKLLRTPLK